MSTTCAENNWRFLDAIRLGNQALARELLPQVSWQDFNAKQNPVERVLYPELWRQKSPHNFLLNNRNEVAAQAYKRYDFSDLKVQYGSGMEALGNVWQCAVYLIDTFNLDVKTNEKEAPMYIFLLSFHPESCAIASVKVSSLQDKLVGGLKGFKTLHKKVSIHSTAEEMPDFVIEVLKWCIDNGRSDLLTNKCQEISEQRGPANTQFLYRLLDLFQVGAALVVLDAGADPSEKFSYKGKYISLLDAIEKDLGYPAAHVVKSHMLRRAAISVMNENETLFPVPVLAQLRPA